MLREFILKSNDSAMNRGDSSIVGVFIPNKESASMDFATLAKSLE
jgi:hypothetical protein